MLLKSMAVIAALFTCLSASAIDKLVKSSGLDDELTSVEDLQTNKFILQNEGGLVLCTPSGWDIKVGQLVDAVAKADQGLYFQIEDLADHKMIGVYNVDGGRRTFWAGNQCVNAQPTGNVIFGLGCTSPQYGQDGANLGLWDVAYEEGKGFAFHCVGRDVYIGYDADAARPSESVVYWKAYKSYHAGYEKDKVIEASKTLPAKTKDAVKLNDDAYAAYTQGEQTTADLDVFGDAVNAAIDLVNKAEDALKYYADLNLKDEGAAEYQKIVDKYNNGEYETVDALIEALRGAAKLQTSAGSNMTGAIINPSFETGTLEGWTSVDGGNIAGNFNFGHITGTQFVERWTNSNNGGKLSDGTLLQTLTGMPNGTYTLTAEMQNLEQGNGSANGTGYYLVINDDKTAVQTAGETVSVTSKVKDGTLVIGAKLEGCSGNWVCIDNFQLTFVEPLAPGEEDATEEDLKPLLDEASYAKTLGVDVTAWLDKTYTVAEIAEAIKEVKVAEYAAVKANYSMDASALIPGVNTWEGTLVSNKGQHWDGTATSTYYEQTGAQWGASSWDASSKVAVTLPKGKYVVYAAGRASSGNACKAYIKVNDVTVEFASNGDAGKGINVKGDASFADDDTYANGNNGRGFEYRYIPFEVTGEEDQNVEITIGGSSTAAHQWMSVCAPVLLTTSDNAAIVKDVLVKDVEAAKAIVDAKAGVGDGLFQIPTEAYDTFVKAVEAAQAVADNADATVADVEAAQKALADAKAAYEATPVTAPAADKQYVLSLKTSDENSPFELSIASEKISIASEGTPVSFVAVDGGYAVSNGTEYVAYAGGNTWSLKASADDAYAWTIAAVEGGYTIQGKNGFLGTNSKDGSAAGSSCYGNKKSTDGFYIWTIEEAPAPALATIKSFDVAKWPGEGAAFNEDNMTYRVSVTVAADVDESVGNAVVKVKGIIKSGEESTEFVSENISFVDIAESVTSDIALPVEYGKSYTFDVTSVSLYSVSEEEGVEPTLLAEKTFAEGEKSVSFDIPEAPKPALAAIADDATVTLPEGELEVDEDGFVKATLTGKITVDESIASDAQAFLMYTLAEQTEEAGDEDEPVQAIKGGVNIDADEEEDEYAELQFDLESQEVLLPVEAGKKYTLTVKGIVVNYYDEEAEDMVTAAEKKFEGDNAVVLDFATKEEAPVLAELAYVTLKAEDDAAIDEEDGTFPVKFGYGLNVHESIAAMASGTVYYTVEAVDAADTDEPIKGSTDFDVAKDERTIYVPGLDYSTKYIISVDSVIISYFDTETFEEMVAGKFTEPTAAASFTTNAKPEPVPEFDIAKEFTSLESLKGAVFAIVNKETGKALYGPNDQNLGYDVAEVAFAETNAGFYFKVDTLSKGTEEECYALRMLTPAGEEYNIWGRPGYLNSQPAETGWCSFILGLNNQNGEDMKDGAVWDIQYVEGKGFTLLNKGTGKYLTSNDAAKSDEPVYWTFCTINGTKIATGIDGINAAKAADGKYIENGKVVIVKNGKKISVAGFGIK